MSKKKPSLILALAAGVAGIACMPVAAGVVFTAVPATVNISIGIAMLFASVWLTFIASD
jgi:hypothetical protein